MIELRIDAMTCGHCVRTITETVQSIDPEARVDADVETKRVRIDNTRPMPELTHALADAGYPATSV